MIYAFGDIHGFLDPIKNLINKLPLKNNDLLVFTGDYIDRGPDSKGVIDFLIDLNRNKKCVFLRGNHEDMMLRSFGSYVDKQIWKQNGGRKTISSYKGKIHSIPTSHRMFLNRTKFTFETDDFFMAHAGINPRRALAEQKEDDLLWIRDEFLYAPKLPTKKIVVHGHTPINVYQSPMNNVDRVCVDSGVHIGGNYFCIRLDDMKMFKS